MRKPRKCRNCGAEKEPLPRGLPVPQLKYVLSRYQTGRLKPPTCRWAMACACPGCGKGIVFVYAYLDYGVVKIHAVDAASWATHPSTYYVRGYHTPHVNHCHDFLKYLGRMREFKKSDYYVECPEVPI